MSPEKPEKPQPSQWRTVGTLLVFGVMLLSTLWVCAKDMRPALVPVVVGGLVTLGVAAVGNSGFEKWVKRGQSEASK